MVTAWGTQSNHDEGKKLPEEVFSIQIEISFLLSADWGGLKTRLFPRIKVDSVMFAFSVCLLEPCSPPNPRFPSKHPFITRGQD